MIVGVLGINHKCADLGLREKLAKACENSLEEKLIFQEFSYVILSTCNRTEIYFSSNDLSQTHSILLHILRFDVIGEFEHKLYSYFHSDCFFHLIKVTSGLDSAILLETEIQGQVKQAYEKAQSTSKLSKELHYMFQKSFKIAKYIRSTVTLGRGNPTLEEAALHKVCEHHLQVTDKRILFIGASDINKKLIAYFLRKKLGSLFLCNRTLNESVKSQINIIPWKDRSSWVDFSTVIVATKSYDLLLKKEEFKENDQKRLLIDLSVPRNIDPLLGNHPCVSLLNIDQLNSWVNDHQKSKTQDIEKVISFIDEAAKRQIANYHTKEKIRDQKIQTIFA